MLREKGTPKRPRAVPQGARWVAPLWQYGTVDDGGRAQGLWCGWKKNGGLAYVAHLENDAVEGASVEFHPDGSLFRRATYAGGALVGIEEFFAPTQKSDEPFPADKPVARVVVDHGDGGNRAKRFFLIDGAECNEQGTPLSALVNDAPFLVRESETFARKNLAAYVKHRIKVTPSVGMKAKAARQPGLSRELAALWGTKPKGAIKIALSLLETARLPRYLGEFICDPAASLSGQTEGATAESIIGRGQRSVGALPIDAMLSGLVPIGTDAGGNVFSLAVFDDGGEAHANVYSVGREEADLLVESDDFCTFVLWSAASEATGGGMLSPRVRAHLAKLFSSHVRDTELGELRWPPAPFDQRETKAQFRHRRGAWLVALLAGEPVDVIVEHFENLDAGPLDRALAARLDGERAVALAPPDLVYALFRSHIAADPRLPALLEVADKSRSSLAVSTAALVRTLEGGRNRLGTIKDLGAIRRAVKHAILR